jgi:hypothetical protein
MEVNGVWKSLALVAVTILVAGAPGMIYALRTWSVTNRIDLIGTRQDDVRERLARLEVKYDALLAQQQLQEQQIRDLEANGP